ncbi:hypothetical protein [Azospirillum sp. sgz302134]
MTTARQDMTGNEGEGDTAKPRRRSASELDTTLDPTLGKEPLQVRIPTLVKRQFKAAAAMRGLEPHELFVEVWEHYQRTRAE